MLQLQTVFDDNGYPESCRLINGEKSKNIILYQKGTGLKLKDINKSVSLIKKIIEEKEVVINDVIKHLRFFNISPYNVNRIYELYIDKWTELVANVQKVYWYIESRGMHDGYRKLKFQYSLTKTGRAKCFGDNILGFSKDSYPRISITDDNWYLCFDWIAADLRAVAIMSEDRDLLNTYGFHDPYSELSNGLGIERLEAKKRILSGLYSLNIKNNEVFEAFPRSYEWLVNNIDLLRSRGYLDSILGRRFHKSDNFGEKSVFSGTIQGSVAHGMHNVMYKLFQLVPQNLLFDEYDSVILSCNKSEIPGLINKIKDVMLYPFDDNKKFPLKISVGKEWKKWKIIKEIR